MRSLGLRLLISVAAAVLSIRAAAAKELEWETVSKNGVTLDKPKGWTWSVADHGHTIWLYSGKHDTSLALGLARRKASDRSDAYALAKDWVERNGFSDPKIQRDYSYGSKDFAMVYAIDGYQAAAMRVGARVEVDREAQITTMLFFRGREKEFRSTLGWEILDRIHVSRNDESDASHHSTWTWSVQQHDDTSILLPDGWSSEVATKDGGLVIQAYDGDRPDRSSLMVRILRIPLAGRKADASSLERALVKKRFPTAHLINARDGYWPTSVYATSESRLAVRTTVSGDYAVVVMGLGKPTAFWRADLMNLLDGFEHSVGLANDDLLGLWMGGSARGVLLHYDGAGHFLDSSSEEAGLLIAFYSDGTYEHRYMYSNGYTLRTQLSSEEKGSYRYDGYHLTLTPTKRIVHYKIGNDDVKTRVYGAKSLPTSSATLYRVLAQPDQVRIKAAGLRYAGHFPEVQEGNAKETSGFDFDRVPLKDVSSTAGFKKGGKRGKKKARGFKKR